MKGWVVKWNTGCLKDGRDPRRPSVCPPALGLPRSPTPNVPHALVPQFGWLPHVLATQLIVLPVRNNREGKGWTCLLSWFCCCSASCQGTPGFLGQKTRTGSLALQSFLPWSFGCWSAGCQETANFSWLLLGFGNQILHAKAAVAMSVLLLN